MSYAVVHPNGAKESDFEEYARLLRQQGVNLARAPRILEQGTGRWLHVWGEQHEAQTFAQELARRTSDKAWKVEKVAATASPGPLGPVLVLLVRRSDGLQFGLHPLSRAMLRVAFPDAVSASSVFFDAQRWHDYQQTKGDDLADLCWQMAFALTGLGREQLEPIGLALLDADSNAALFREKASQKGKLTRQPAKA